PMNAYRPLTASGSENPARVRSGQRPVGISATSHPQALQRFPRKCDHLGEDRRQKAFRVYLDMSNWANLAPASFLTLRTEREHQCLCHSARCPVRSLPHEHSHPSITTHGRGFIHRSSTKVNG